MFINKGFEINQNDWSVFHSSWLGGINLPLCLIASGGLELWNRTLVTYVTVVLWIVEDRQSPWSLGLPRMTLENLHDAGVGYIFLGRHVSRDDNQFSFSSSRSQCPSAWCLPLCLIASGGLPLFIEPQLHTYVTSVLRNEVLTFTIFSKNWKFLFPLHGTGHQDCKLWFFTSDKWIGLIRL